MQKSAVTDHSIHNLLSERWSPVVFDGRPVKKEVLLSLLEAIRWAPSCFNAQPWSFMLASRENPEEFKRMLSCLVEGNQVWAKNAGALLLSVARLDFEHNGKENRHAYHDVGLAAMSLTVQAADLGLHVHQMGGFNHDLARSTYSIPEGFDVVTAIAVGTVGDLEAADPSLKERDLGKRSRKNLEDFVFEGSWEQKTSSLTL
jgi:nitroreductase